MVWKPIVRRITPFRRIHINDRLLRPWLYPRVEPEINFPDIQIEVLPNGDTIAHTNLDEEAILEALKEEEH